MYKTLRAIVRLLFSNFFQSSIFDEYFIPFHLHLFIKGSTFEAPSGCDSISSWFNATVTAYWKHLSSLFFRFLHTFCILFYDIYNTTVGLNQFGIFKNSICIIIRHKFYIAALWVHYTLFTNIFRWNKVNCDCQLNVPWIRFMKINYFILQIRFNIVKVLFYW